MAEDEDGNEVVLPFSLDGITSVINVLPLTSLEFDEHEHTRIELTSKDLTWDPSTTVYENQENAMVDYKGKMTRRPNDRGPMMVIKSVTISTTESAGDVLSEDNFSKALELNVNVLYTAVRASSKALRW